ncbi:M13 family peptidase [Phaffia rhodozyma]|uniref:M13 family peptidase n=1 Tax=Phaffia rhodozyma TaxID=264483 RepID=A0A0F7SIT7_PHARH|nr:M13 family peptidase [Phaffia rhodozyma]
MAEATARPSTDLESSPLLTRVNDGSDIDPPRRSFWKRLSDPQRELTLLEKLLALLVLLFLLLSAIFIGLFSGSQHKLHEIQNQPPVTVTKTRHSTSYGTSTATATATATTTQISTTTVVGPAPVPTPTEVPLPPVTPCLTPDCILLSSSILQALDASIDPCEDPYGAFTGGWLEKNPLPKSKGKYGSFNEVAKNNQKILLDVLTHLKASEEIDLENPEKEAERSNLLKLKTVFDDCMAEDHLDALSYYPLVPLIEDIKSLFPVVYTSHDEDHEEEDDAVFDAQEIETDSKHHHDHQPKHHPKHHDHKKGSKEEAKRRKDKLTKVLSYLHSKGIDSLFSFENEGDIGDDPQKQILWLYQDGLGLPAKEYYAEKTYTDIYTEVMASILSTVYNVSESSLSPQFWPSVPHPFPFPGVIPDEPSDERPPSKDPKSSPVNAQILAKRILALEKKLAKAQAEPEYLGDPSKSYNPVKFETLEKELEWLDLRSYVSSFAPRKFPEKIVLTSEDYVKKVVKIVEEEDDIVLQGYFLIRTAMSYASYLGPNVQIRQDAEKLKNTLTGVKQGNRPEREEVCLNHVSAAVGHLAGAEFVKKAFTGDSKNKAEDVILNIIDAFKRKLVKLPWMDKESARLAVRKADVITPKIGYPLYPNTTSPLSLQRYYSRLVLNKGDFLGNFVRVNEMDKIRQWQVEFGVLRNRDSWLMNADTVNAYESPADNEIVFPAGILQPPFFSAKWPSYLHYGAFGAVAAHELCHAFDNSGAQYDYEGRYRQWWTNSTVDAFRERAQCIAKQYSEYYVLDAEGHKVYVKGNNTNGEAIGDSGLRIAYEAWQASIKQGDKEITLPGLPYTSEQLFFIAFGRIWAANVAPASLVAQVRSDPHAPNLYRVEGTLRNFEKFAEVFQCKKGSKMNPTQRCELW